MSRTIRWIGIVLILTALLSSGCSRARQAAEDAIGDAVGDLVGRVSEGVEGTRTATPGIGEPVPAQPTAAPEQPSDGGDDVGEALDPEEVTAYDQLGSYRLTQRMQWQIQRQEDTEEGGWLLEVAYVREPPAMHWRMTGKEGPDDEDAGTMEMIWVDGATYMSFGDEWMAMVNEEDMQNPWSDPPQAYIASNSERVGIETVNGYRCIHYRAKEDAAILGVGAVASGEYWVSEEHNVVVRSIVEWTGADASGEEGRWTLQWDLTDINQPITITAPEGVSKPGIPEDVPLMPGATNVSSMMGMNSFEVEATADEVTEFYMQALEENGWTFDSSVMDTMHVFTKGNRALTLMINADETPTSVVIMIEEN